MKFRRRRRDGLPAVATFRDPGPRGYTGQGGGEWRHLTSPLFYRGTSDQIAYLYPGILGSSVPITGVPIGKITRKVRGKRKGNLGAALCCDPWSWYRAKLISNPSAFILGLPGLGKSTLLRRWILGLDYFGVTSLVLGDLKGEHVELVRAMGGQVIRVGRGAGCLNVLDMGSAPAAVEELRDAGEVDEANQLEAVSRARRQAATETLLNLQLGRNLTGKEIAILAAALAELDRRFVDATPIPIDLLTVIEDPTDEVAAAAGAGNYLTIADDMIISLRSMAAGHGLGEVFGQATTVRFDVYKHAVFDVSGLDDSDELLRAAALMICWSIGFGEVSVANTLAAAGLAEQRQWHIVMDELWRALRAAPGLPQRVDGLTRLNRDKGVATSFASHTMNDLAALQSEADRRMAAGILERCGMVVAFGCAASEMPRLQSAVKLTRAEQATLTSWTTPPSLSANSSVDDPWPGRGLCLVKIGSRPGLPVEISLTDAEEPYHRTAKKWEDQAA